MVPVFRLLSRIDNSKDRYIIFSQSEIDLYAEHLGIDRSKMHYLPCGDWGHDPEPSDIHIPANTKPGDYYFSGGYSNRDYLSLIEAFRKIPARLMIICSSLNKELDCVPVPPNVEVLRDVPSSAFEAYLRNSKAGIISLKHDTGASRQSVMLRLMCNARATIASDVGAVRESITECRVTSRAI